jgi:protein-S-isoprenylcysteine O-methyltransferase Ste14
MPKLIDKIIYPHHLRQQYGILLMIALIVVPNNIPSLGYGSIFIGLVLCIEGSAIRIWSTGYLHKNNELTTSGPYGYVRNPIYVGNMLLAVGLILMSGHFIWGTILTVFLYVICYIPGMRVEEENLRSRFGESFEKFASSVPLIFPSPRRVDGFGGGTWTYGAYIRNKEHYVTIGTVIGLAYLFYQIYQTHQ